MTIALIIAVAAWILTEAKHFLAERRWDTQRRELCARLQAGTLQDYMMHVPVAEPQPASQLDEDDLPPIGEDMPFAEYNSLAQDVESELSARLGAI